MANISFNEPHYGTRMARGSRSYLSDLVIRAGLAKTQGGAQAVLLVIAVLCIAIAMWVVSSSMSTPLPSVDIVPSPVKQ